MHSSVALGVLLADGLGDTVRVSLTDDPEKEVKVGLEILRALNLRAPGPSVTSCPTCGRTKCDVKAVAELVERELEMISREFGPSVVLPHVAVMGCVVNGPGEAKNAEIALCGGVGEFFFYQNGERVKRVPQEEAVSAIADAVREYVRRRDFKV